MKKVSGLIMVVAVLTSLFWNPVTALAEPRTHHITIRNFNFYPPDVLINIGDTVIWTNEMKYGHWVISGVDMTHDSMFFSYLLQDGNSFSFTFRTAGEYTYYCPIHSMQAIVYVMDPDEFKNNDDGNNEDTGERTDRRRRK